MDSRTSSYGTDSRYFEVTLQQCYFYQFQNGTLHSKFYEIFKSLKRQNFLKSAQARAV